MRILFVLLSTIILPILTACELSGNEQKTSIFYSPHADDEVLSLGPSILHHRERGDRVVVVLLSEGKASGAFHKVNEKLEEKGLPTITRDEFGASRVSEFKKSVEALGVKPDDVFVYQLPDGDIQKEDVKKIMKEMNERYPSATNHALSYLDPHHDHAASGYALKELMEEEKNISGLFYIPVQEHKNIDSEGSYKVPERYKEGFTNSLNTYKIWNPDNGFYAIGNTSVLPYFNTAEVFMESRWHD
ncbi:PIG-L deacetylase family protein [Metabacillus rhizolycopersici]|uniref:PIG-L family deacetylase n=1 Tax=Metabacillus rhizolycopersici TaxID=2875709 RepID=A0ABS7UL94_9BACI|nr:PIG-L family deacetylase [Metabacillus rhizolycopersici]MBZ5749083.1 PIG-L family deacetylase [Metabacillus rhizolycopersici]